MGVGTMPEVDWGSVNWALTDAMLARQWGVSRERVRQKRKRLGAPAPTHPKSQGGLRYRLEPKLARLEDPAALTTTELARALGVSPPTADRIRRELTEAKTRE
jgi:hypothetical protein